jgi:hypothetical protein
MAVPAGRWEVTVAFNFISERTVHAIFPGQHGLSSSYAPLLTIPTSKVWTLDFFLPCLSTSLFLPSQNWTNRIFVFLYEI